MFKISNYWTACARLDSGYLVSCHLCWFVLGLQVLCYVAQNTFRQKNSQTFYNKIYSGNISALCIEIWMKRLLKNRHHNDKKYNSVTINTASFQYSNFFPQEGIAPCGSADSRYWGYAITLRHTTLIGLLWMSDQPDSKTSTWQQNTHMRQAFMAPAGFEPVISETERP
jgi:hypothetical protein